MALLAKGNNVGGSSYDRPRKVMVDEQLKARGIVDEKVLAAMGEMPRHLFVPEALRDNAYHDKPLPIGHGQTISQPFMVALMSQLLELTGNEKVLEIGTGSGYQTAILSRLCGNVYSVERLQPLLVQARSVLEKLGIYNCALKVFDGTLGWRDFAPFDAIMVTAGGPEIPKPLVDQLRVGGKMVIPIGDEQEQVLYKVIKTNSGIREIRHSACTFVKLVGEYGWKEKQ